MLNSSAATFRTEADAGNIGINIGVAAPMAFFPFTGWKDSFFGDLHGQGWDAVEFLRTLAPALHTCTCAASAGECR
jgi:acyl-CoA reductase-like NAD-dependent aldehyde dehydrogenase